MPPVTRAADVYAADSRLKHSLSGRLVPLFLCRVEAGFPSPGDDFVEGALDLNDLCVRDEAATFFVRVSGHSMTGAGIRDGDLLVVNRATEAKDGAVVIAALGGDLTAGEAAPPWRAALPRSGASRPPAHRGRHGPARLGRRDPRAPCFRLSEPPAGRNGEEPERDE